MNSEDGQMNCFLITEIEDIISLIIYLTCSKQEFNHKFIHLSLVCLVIVYVLELQWHRLHPDNPSIITLWLTKVAVLGKYLKATILGTCDAAVLACFNPPHSPLFTFSPPAMQIS